MDYEMILFNLINEPSNTYIGEAPIDVDNCQWIRTSSGRSEVFFGKDNYDHVNYTVYVRNTSNKDAQEKAKELFNKIRNWTDSQTSLIATRTPRYAGRDVKYRSVYAFQLELQTGGY